MARKRNRSIEGAAYDREPKRQPQQHADGSPHWSQPSHSNTPATGSRGRSPAVGGRSPASGGRGRSNAVAGPSSSPRAAEEGDYANYPVKIANIHGPDYRIPLDYTRNAHLDLDSLEIPNPGLLRNPHLNPHLRTASYQPIPLWPPKPSNAGPSASGGKLFGEITNRPWEEAFPGVPGIGTTYQPKPDDPPLEPGMDPPTLKGTSQGPRNCAPPTHWIKEELVKFGAIGTPGIYIMDLEEPQYLDPQRFKMKPKRLEAFGQSLSLIGLLLETSAAYFANMFPRKPSFYYMDGAPDKQRVVMNENIDKRERVFTFEYLMAFINTHVVFREDTTVFAKRGRFAVVHPSHVRFEQVPFESTGFDNHMTHQWHNAAKSGIAREDWYHHITITFASEFVDVMLESAPGSEERLIATVSAATLIIHHIAFATRLAHVRSHYRENYRRWVGLDVERDDGYALEGWLFGGVHPWLYSRKRRPCPFIDLDWDDGDDTDPPINPATFAPNMAIFAAPKKRVNPSAPPPPNFLKRLLATKSARTRTGKDVEPYSDWWYEGGIKKLDDTPRSGKKPDDTTRSGKKPEQRMASSNEEYEEDEEPLLTAAAAIAVDDELGPFLPRDTDDEDEDPFLPEPSEWDGNL
ncbi:hypothetical protein MMC11_006591 [Xylographa trunciseda]|nr:hypothetical protein [Xylographa trunciseda]